MAGVKGRSGGARAGSGPKRMSDEQASVRGTRRKQAIPPIMGPVVAALPAVAAPEDLPEDERVVWDRLAPLALVSRTLTPETVDAFADLCETIVVQREMLATIRRDGLMQTLLTGASVVSQAHPLIAKWTALKVRVEASKARFLLTGTGKPAVALEQPKDEWSEFETPLRAVK